MDERVADSIASNFAPLSLMLDTGAGAVDKIARALIILRTSTVLFLALFKHRNHLFILICYYIRLDTTPLPITYLIANGVLGFWGFGVERAGVDLRSASS